MTIFEYLFYSYCLGNYNIIKTVKIIFSGYTYMVYSVLVWEAGLWTTWQTLTRPSLEYCRPSPAHWTRLNFHPDWRWCCPRCVENHCCLPAPGQREERGGWSRWGGEFCRTPQRLRMSHTVGWWWLTHLCRNITVAITVQYLILLLFIWHCMYRERERGRERASIDLNQRTSSSLFYYPIRQSCFLIVITQNSLQHF